MPKVTRLYQYFQPKHYDVTLAPDATTLLFSGTVTISGLIMKSDKKIRLHAKELNITEVKLGDQLIPFELDVEHDELVLLLSERIEGAVTVTVSFSGVITKQMHGLYPSVGRDGKIILATQFESHHAREVFPCIDEPEAKATFDLTLQAPANTITLANTPEASSHVHGKQKTTTFERTPIMSTYLLAFVIGDLISKETKTKDGVLVRTWATPDQANFTDFALDVATRTLEFYNDYFDIPYPLQKCDMVALPDFASGAMENWGLVTYRETCMLVDPTNTSLATKQFVAMVVAHELAHQWFGNLVTMQWWTDLWLNEGFASWIEYMAIDKLFPEWHMWTQFIVDEQQAALRLDALKNTHPVEVEVNHPDEIPTIFDTISYAKGSSVIHMLHAYLGAENFRKGLAHYLKKHAYGNTVTSDLWDALSAASGKPVAEFMSSWTSKPGFPLVKVTENNGNLELKQEHFFANPSQRSGAQLWPVPLLSDDISLSILTDKTASVKPKSPNQYKLNIGQAGFYHTKYPKDHYTNLGQLVRSKTLQETDRLGLLADALALNKSGDLKLEQLLNLLTFYEEESSSPVWDIIASLIADIRRVMGDEIREACKPLIRNLTEKQVTRLGWIEHKNDSHFDKLLRPGILGLASGADNEAVTTYALRLFAETTTVEMIPSNIRGVVLGTASRTGNKDTFDKIFGFYQNTISPEDKVVLASALTNFRTKREFNRALKLITSEHVRLQDVGYWLAYSLMNPSDKATAWEWVQKNWSWLEKNLGNDMSFSRLPMYAARARSDTEFLKEYEEFFASVHSASLDRAIKQGAETIKTQAAWRERDEQALLNWLKAQ